MARQRRWKKLPPEFRRQVMRGAARGLTQRQITAAADVSLSAVIGVLRPLGGVIPPDVPLSNGNRLSLEDRVEIRVGLEQGHSLRRIARTLTRAPSTISREVKANGGLKAYRPVSAQRTAISRARRPKTTKLAAHPQLCAEVTAGLQQLWSPQQISAHLAATFDDDPSMNVSHETIYKSLYVQGRGELRRELTRCLRSGRAVRKPHGRLEKRGRIPGMVLIADRPAEINDREVPGHWEGDLIVGKNGVSAIGTLVERTTRFVMLLHLSDKRAETVRDAMTAKIATLPAALARSITWDQGIEMSQHARFSVDTGIPVYFCDPHSPWQRGTNENTNGLLRQYFPKGTDLSLHSEADLDAAADSLNTRPRQTLGWMTPSHQLAKLVATTA
jgi:transposase, IS30 family